MISRYDIRMYEGEAENEPTAWNARQTRQVSEC